MRSVKLALSVGIALLAVAIVAVLARAPLTVAGTNSVPAPIPVALTDGSTSSCQVGRLPKATAGIRVSLASGAGPRLRLRVYSHSRLVTKGERPAGWGLEANVIIPMEVVQHKVPHALFCIEVGPAVEPVQVLGTPIHVGSSQTLDFKQVKLRFEYLRRGPKPWWSRASSVAYHMGLGHAPSGAWLALFVLVVMITIAILAVRLTLEDLR